MSHRYIYREKDARNMLRKTRGCNNKERYGELTYWNKLTRSADDAIVSNINVNSHSPNSTAMQGFAIISRPVSHKRKSLFLFRLMNAVLIVALALVIALLHLGTYIGTAALSLVVAVTRTAII
jgi:hypothetical protein